MSDPKKMSTMTMVLIGIGVLGLCCVGSCGVAMIGGVAAGAQNPIAASASTSGTGIEGLWGNAASSSFTEYRNVMTGSLAPPSGTGAVFEFKPGGSCEHYVLFQSSLYGCTSSIFVAHDDCEWELEGDQLTLSCSGGEQLTKACGGEQKRETLSSSTGTYTVLSVTPTQLQLKENSAGGTLTLHH